MTLAHWVGFNQVPGIGVVRLRRLVDAFGDVAAAWEAPAGQLTACGLPPRAVSALVEARRRLDLGRELERVRACGAEVVTIDDERYPSRLRQIYAAPPVLFVKGELPPGDAPLLSIVGTRHATAYGRAITEKLAGELAGRGVWIVSGFARGIDTHAHRAAVEAGGKTLAVFACGLDTIYPPENRELAKKVTQHGALVTELALGSRPEARNFPARNRIVSGIAPATLVVEAGERSGALITAEFALAQGRDVLAVPGPVTSPRSAGTNRLIRDGATLIQSADDVLEALGFAERPAAAQLPLGDLLPVDADEQALLARLADEPMLVDDLAHALGKPLQDVLTGLTMLELKGRVRQAGGLYYLLPR